MTTRKIPNKPALPTTDAETIAFALDRLHDRERIESLEDWRAGRDVKWALEVIATDKELAA